MKLHRSWIFETSLKYHQERRKCFTVVSALLLEAVFLEVARRWDHICGSQRAVISTYGDSTNGNDYSFLALILGTAMKTGESTCPVGCV